MKLTVKEQLLYDSIVKGMDEPGCGWLHELAPCDWAPRTRSGVVGSLVKKKLILTHKEPTPAGFASKRAWYGYSAWLTLPETTTN